MKAFLLRWDYFFPFLQGSLNPQNYKLAPQIPEKITIALKLLENN